MSSRPKPYPLPRFETVYMDFTTGNGVLSSGQRFSCRVSAGRKHPSLADKLDTVQDVLGFRQEKARVIFTGKVPKADPSKTNEARHWLITRTPGWEVDEKKHWLGTPPTGRFRNIATRKYIELRTAGEWFGSITLTPDQARQAFDLLDSLLSTLFAKWMPAGSETALMNTPGATGMNLWALALPPGLNTEPLTEEIAEEMHATSGQHHIEHLVEGPSMDSHPDVLPLVKPSVTPKLDRFCAIDGRFMYASLCRELGTGPGIRLSRAEAFELLETKPYARARYQVRFTVPHGWHNVGIFAQKHSSVAAGWYYPNRPGATGITWADGAEVFVAKKFGWGVEPLQAVVFNESMNTEHKRFVGGDAKARRTQTKARPLDRWAERLTEAREAIAADPEIPAGLKAAIGAALRAMLIQTIGKFASRGRGGTMVEYDPKRIPAEYAQSVQVMGEAYVYHVPEGMTAQQQLYYHPEFAVQVWGRGRAKVLHSKAGGMETGALTLPGSSILGIRGDAVYTSELPRWALPTEQGGADDGRAGRLRLQGVLPGPVKAPAALADRDRLSAQAAKAGVEAAPEMLMDQAAFDFEFAYQDDDPSSYRPSDEDQEMSTHG